MTRLTGEARHAAIDEAAALRAHGLTYEQIAERTGHSRAKVAHLLREGRMRATSHNTGVGTAASSAQDPVSHDGAPESSADPVTGRKPSGWELVSADQRRAMLTAYLRTTYQVKAVSPLPARTLRTVAAAGDFHGQPDPDILAMLVATQADIYVLGGDLTDQQHASAHPSMTRDEKRRQLQVGAQAERATMRAMLETLLEETRGDLHIIPGNHDLWTFRQWMASIPAGMLDLYPEMLDAWRDPIDMIADQLGDRVKRVGHEVHYFFPNGGGYDTKHQNEFMYILGDVMFSHLNKTGGVTETGVSKVWRMFFVNWERRLFLRDVRMICHFHVHARNMHVAGDMLLIEPGMAGLYAIEGYRHGYQAKWRPSVQGFVRFQQYKDGDGWLTDLSSVDMVAPMFMTADVIAAC